jgi:TDG/mug DNA glycosylase family protein
LPVILPDYLAPGLDVVSVGAAPSLYAAERGHYYAGPRNRFWLLLHQSGLTRRQLREEEDFEVLQFGIGLTALFTTIASSENGKLPTPTNDVIADLNRRLMRHSPKIICYNGKDVHKLVTGSVTARWGIQQGSIGNSLQFIVPSTSGRADGCGAERLYRFQQLNALIKSLSLL